MKLFRTPLADHCEGPGRVHRFRVATRYASGLVLHCPRCGTLAVHGEAIHRFEMFEQEHDAGRDAQAASEDLLRSIGGAGGLEH